MTAAILGVSGVAVLVAGYAYAGYPLLLAMLARLRRPLPVHREAPALWPAVTITLPAYNAERTLAPVLDALVNVDYPREKRRIVVVSDGSTDGTDALVGRYAPEGVELLRIEGRLGKTEVENRAMASLSGDIIVNTDASVTIDPAAVKALVTALQDPTVGVASGRDISVESVGAKGHASEAAYVGYEMWIRDLETKVYGIIGSSGCLYAIRSDLHRRQLPGHLSRDFSSALWAHLNGVRAVSVRDALCFVPRAASMQIEYRRKIRTMSRGIQTLFHHAALMNPLRYGAFAWMLISHKLLRWLVPWCVVALSVAAPALWVATRTSGGLLHTFATLATAAVAAGLILAAVGWWWPAGRKAPRLASIAAYFVSGSWAGIVAWWRALRDQRAPVWEPTPRALGAKP